MKPEELERMIEAARDYNEPPEPPREEMWAAIREALPQSGADDLSARRRARSDRVRRWTPWAVGLAAAAMLAVGFGLGRLTQTPVAPVTADGAVATAEDHGRTTPVQLAAAEHMSDAEALLTLFRSAGPSEEDRAAAADWARELLSTTRMLLDSRVADDPEMANLLEDLETVLVQIANAGGDQDDDLIEEGIRQQQLMAKLRTAAAPADIAL